jgi:hypothetical protein
MSAIDSRQQQGATAQTGFGAFPIFLHMGTGNSFPGVKCRGGEVGHSYLSSRAEVKHALGFKERCSHDRSEGLPLH